MRKRPDSLFSMRSKKVTRYYCDHCRKGMLKRPAMARHEAGCISNPDRTCGLCKQKPDIQGLIAYHKLIGRKESFTREEMAELQTKLGGCPCCLLAVMKQSNVFPDVHDDPPWIYTDERDKWFAEQNLEEYREN